MACGVKKLDQPSDLPIRQLADPPSDSGTGSSAACSACSSAAASMSWISRMPCSATS
jgi:hypothetical protein